MDKREHYDILIFPTHRSLYVYLPLVRIGYNFKKSKHMEDPDESFDPFKYPEIQQLLYDLLNTLFDESGRGALLIATAHVDEQLTKLIEAIFPHDLSKKHRNKLLTYPGPISSFSSKIELAYVFRLINKSLYDNLNALRKLRNDAAHSPAKFDLFDLNAQMKSVYEIGTGFSRFIKEVSTKAVVQQKIDYATTILDKSDLDQDSKNELLRKVFEDQKKIEMMKREVPYWELIYGLVFLCGLIVHQKENIKKLTSDIVILGQLLDSKD